MFLTCKQTHILENLERVAAIPFKTTAAKLPRYQLDGRECSKQITALVVKKLVTRTAQGGLSRAAA